MKLSNLIDERDERTRRRKKIKRKMDSIIGLSYNGEVDDEKNAISLSMNIAKLADKSIRLLDEGYFDSGFVIKKGTLEKYLNGENQYVRGWEMTDNGWEQTPVLNLNDDFVGHVNIGHMDFATFPFIVGEWNKSDLSIVSIGNDRKGIDVALRLDKKSVFVKELARQPYDIGISSEFWYHINEEDTEALSETLGTYMPVIDEVFIFAYGLVGECGNVNSSGLELKGVDMKTEEKLALETVEMEMELDGAEDAVEEIEEIEEVIEEAIEEEVTEEVAEEEVEEEATEEVVELSANDADEETEDEDAEDESSDEEDVVEEDEDEEDLDDEDEIEEVDELTEALSVIHELRAQVAELSNINAELKKNNRRLSKKLAKENEKKMKFLEETKNLSVELYENELEAKQAKEEELAAVEEQKDYVLTGGIADI